jgi:hypothetical protein
MLTICRAETWPMRDATFGRPGAGEGRLGGVSPEDDPRTRGGPPPLDAADAAIDYLAGSLSRVASPRGAAAGEAAMEAPRAKR